MLAKSPARRMPMTGRFAAASRREFLLLSTASLALTACSEQPPSPAPIRKYTIESLLGTTPFYIAHRGSGDNWPEHTALAYSSAIAFGVKAIEISVCATADGVLVCHHDTNTLELTGHDLEISKQTYATLSGLRNDARQWLGPASQPQPIPRLKDVLDAHAATHVIFIEDKQATNTKALLDLMDSYPDSKNHFVWKQPASSKTRVEAAARGYKTWGYFMDGSSATYDKYAPNLDFLGVYQAATDAEVTALMVYGKPVIAWEVHTRWMRDRLQALGVRGLMCSNVPYVTNDVALLTSDTFASGNRSAGDLPWTIGWDLQPKLLAGAGSIELDDGSDFSYSMGSLCPVPSDNYSITFDVRWPGRVPPGEAQAGIAFGLHDDRPYRPNVPGTSGGYHLLINDAGKLELYRRSANGATSEVVAALNTAAPQGGQWLKFSVTVTPEEIRCSRLDSGGQSLSAADNTYRGGYLMLCKAYDGEDAVEFRSVSVTA
ncbi:Glycerophosphoryl diester phosphodiesterase family protein [Arthrobacter sp. ov407]|nr:Glycerophosphoryl diester phosphodiesterase family protein [Arthrobacter sp. ov407]